MSLRHCDGLYGTRPMSLPRSHFCVTLPIVVCPTTRTLPQDEKDSQMSRHIPVHHVLKNHEIGSFVQLL